MDYNSQAEVKEEERWDLTSLYSSDEDWDKEYLKLKEDIKSITKHENKVMENEHSLYNALEDYYGLLTKITKNYLYASLKHDEDVNDSKYSLMYSKSYALYSEFVSYSSYLTPEILKADENVLNKYKSDKLLVKYKFLLEEIARLRKHTLGSKEEMIISKLTANSGIFDKLNSTLINGLLDYGEVEINGEKVKITNSNYRIIMMNKNREVRENCYNLMSSKLKEFSNRFGDLLISSMKEISTYADIKN